MRRGKILITIVLFIATIVVSATPADDADGASLVKAALIFQDTEGSAMTVEQRFSSLYLLGYVDGCARTLEQSGLASFDKETDLPSVFKDLVLFIGDSKILRTAPTTDLVNAFLLLKYGATEEARQVGLNMTMKLVGEVGSAELAKAKKLAEQGGAEQPATAPESKSEGKEKAKPESEERSQ